MTHRYSHAALVAALTVLATLALMTPALAAAEAPAIDGESSSNISPVKATLEAQVNPNNEATSCKFEYGTTTSYGETFECEPGTLEGFGDQGVFRSIEGLTPSTTYHFRVVVENPTGKTEGADSEFTTPAKTVPTIDSESVSSIAPFSATLEAQINPDDQATTTSFEYATNEALTGASVVAGEPELFGFGDQGASAPLTGLERGTTYYYRVIANNETGASTPGPVQSFTTIGLPSVDDVAPTASAITHREAKLAGTVNPGGSATTYHFEYGPTTTYGVSTPETPAGEGTAGVAVGPQTIIELTPETVYHYRLVATSAAGTNPGADHTFTTGAALAPIVSTGGASGVASSTATISGTLDPRGLPTTYEFDLGTDTSYGTRMFGSAGEEPGTVSLALTNLVAGTTYHYRLCASNQDGTVCGSDRTFATPGVAFPLTGGISTPLVSFPAAILNEIAQAQNKPASGSTTPRKALTKKQRLTRALKACNHKPKSKRAACRSTAKRRFR